MRHETLTTDGLLPIEGPVLLEEAARSGIHIVDIFCRSGTDLPPVLPPVLQDALFELSREVFKTIQGTEHSQGIVATIRPRQYTLDDVFRATPELIIVLGRLQDPGNVGTILRVGESFGATGCIGLQGTAGFNNGKLIRASAGSIFRFPHTGPARLSETAAALRSRNIALVGTSPKASTAIDAWDWRRPTAVLLGNEGQGLSSEELSNCDTVLRIPQKMAVESLNSAIAAAVILYEASKQRRK